MVYSLCVQVRNFRECATFGHRCWPLLNQMIVLKIRQVVTRDAVATGKRGSGQMRQLYSQ